MESQPLFLTTALEQQTFDAFASGFSTWAFQRTIRAVLGALRSTKKSPALLSPTDWIEVSRSRSLEDVLRPAFGSDFFVDVAWPRYLALLDAYLIHGDAVSREDIEERVRFLKILGKSTIADPERRLTALTHVVNQGSYFVGADAIIAEASTLGFESEEPWWKRGPIDAVYSEFQAYQDQEQTLSERGFLKIGREAYVERMRWELIRYILRENPSTLLPAAAMIALATVGRFERTAIAKLTRDLESELGAMLERHWGKQQPTTTVPKRGLFSLPLEMNSLTSYYKALESGEEPGTMTLNKDGVLPTARAQVIEGRQAVLFFDERLLQEDKSGRFSQGIEIELEVGSSTTIEAVLSALSSLESAGVSKNTLRHAPRVVAGIFTAAAQDAQQGRVATQGKFYDTPSASRLSEICGYNVGNTDHRLIVKNLRNILCRIKLHREVKVLDPETGRYRLTRWSGTLLQELNDTFSVETGTQSGGTRNVSSTREEHAYLIGEPLWAMTQTPKDGGAPDFMRLDQRAFRLDAGKTSQFNLYWSLINRATTKGVDPGGAFSIRIGVLIRWAGLEDYYDKPARLTTAIERWLERCIELGLIDSWSCPDLDGERATMSQLEQAQLTVVFSESQSGTLPTSENVQATLEHMV